MASSTVAQVIRDAFRESNLVARDQNLSASEQAEGLRSLQKILDSTFGYEVGENLVSVYLGFNNILQHQYEMFERFDTTDRVLEINTNLVCNLDSAETIYLPFNPSDGARLSIIDNSGNFSTNNLTIETNGSRIEGQTQLILNTDNYSGSWFFRKDTNNWTKVVDLSLNDEFIFPRAFEDYFVITLAMRINPSYGMEMNEQSALRYRDVKGKLAARYAQDKQVFPELGVTQLPYFRGRQYSYNFEKGR